MFSQAIDQVPGGIKTSETGQISKQFTCCAPFPKKDFLLYQNKVGNPTGRQWIQETGNLTQETGEANPQGDSEGRTQNGFGSSHRGRGHVSRRETSSSDDVDGTSATAEQPGGKFRHL